MIVDEFVPQAQAHGMGWEERASDDNIIINICRELGDLIVDRCIGLGDDDTEEEQRPRVQIHRGSPWHECQAIPAPFISIEFCMARRH